MTVALSVDPRTMYKIATDLAQRRARQLWLADLQGDGFLNLTAEEQRASLVAKLKGIDAQIKKHEPKSDWRLALGQVKLELQNQIHALRPKRRADKLKNIQQHIIDVTRELLPKLQFQRIMDEAARRAREPSDSGS